MSEEESSAGNGNSEARMPFYSQPELLTVEDHGGLGINASAQSFDFVKSVQAVPVTSFELTSAQRHYPVVFSSLEQPSLVAVVAALGEQNLFVDEHGQWDESAYIPAYVRCRPFALTARPDHPMIRRHKRRQPSKRIRRLCFGRVPGHRLPQEFII